MKILFVLDYYYPHVGGAEVIYKNYCEGLAKRGHRVNVVTLNHTGNLKDEESVNGVSIHRVKVPLNSRYLFPLFSLFKIWKLTKNADIIHTAFFLSPFAAFIVAKLRKKPIFVTVHEIWQKLWFEFEKNPIKKILSYFGEKFLLLLPYTKVICYSFYTFNSLRLAGVSAKKISFIKNGLDHKLFHPKVSGKEIREKLNLKGKKIYLFFGRPGISKGLEYLIRAASIVKERVKDSRLLLILSNDPKDEYAKIVKMIDELKLRDHVLLIREKAHEEIPKYIAASDIVVVPSLSEGFGFTAAEASAMGKPVVATYVGSLPEIIRNGESGILVKPRSGKELAEAICFLFNNPKYRKKMGKIGLKLMREFSWEKTINALENLYLSHL
jgi:glycosyltransferase involved in cell wall biosynthesis